MRRYGVRFLVAVLTFLLGVALSFGFGPFRVKERKVRPWKHKRHCDERSRVHPLNTLTVVNYENAPLRLVYLGPMPNAARGDIRVVQVLVENTSGRTITQYSLSGQTVRGENDPTAMNDISFTVLRPGESRVSFIPTEKIEVVSLGASWVQFEDGSSWNNPRNPRKL